MPNSKELADKMFGQEVIDMVILEKSKPTLTEWLEKELKKSAKNKFMTTGDLMKRQILLIIRDKIKAGEFSGL
jgi:hypothetical protein